MPKQRGNGEGCVQHLGVNNWKITITIATENGKQKRISKQGFMTKNEAIAWGYRQKEKANPTRATIESLWEGYSTSKMLKLSASQQNKLKLAYTRITDIHNTEIKKLKIKQLQDIVDRQTTFYTKREIKVLLSHLYDRAIAEEYVQTNLSHYIELPKLEEKPRQAFTIEEIQTLWKAYNDGNEFVAYILLLIYTGMMPMELLQCKPSMVDLENHIIVGAGAKTTKRKTSPIQLANDIVPVLKAIMRNPKVQEKDLICPYDKCSFYDHYNATLDTIPSIRHLPPYCCRHTTATILSDMGVNANYIREIMRHSNFQTTTRYIHTSDSCLQNVINSIKIK